MKPVRWATILTVIACFLIGGARPAHADLFKLWAGGLGGAAFGNGGGNDDFFNIAQGGTTGVEVGLQVLFVGVIVDYRYFFGGAGDSPAHMVSVNLGGEWPINITENLSLPVRVQAGYLGGDIVDAAFDNVHDSGFGARAGFGVDYRLIGPLSIGLIPQLGYHAMLAGGGPGATVSHGWDFNILAHLRLGF